MYPNVVYTAVTSFIYISWVRLVAFLLPTYTLFNLYYQLLFYRALILSEVQLRGPQQLSSN